MTAAALAGLSQSLAGSAGALLARRLTGSEALAGLPQAFLVIGAALAALVMSALVPRHGRARTLAAGVLAAAAGCAVVVSSGHTGSLFALLAGMTLVGAGTSAVMLARYAAADLVSEDSRVHAMAGVLVATTVGAVAGPVLLGPTAAAAAALGLPALTGPYLLAAAGFVAAAAAFATAPTPPPGRGRRRGATAGDPRVTGTVQRPALVGVTVLALANLVMVAVMTMAPVHLVHLGGDLGMVGLVVAAHVLAMFGPSPFSGWLTGRVGAPRAATAAGVVLTLACAVLAAAGDARIALVAGLMVLGLGWNLGLVSGSVLLTAAAPSAGRPRREALGEVGMGAAAAIGGAASGPLMVALDFASLALVAGAVALAVTVAAMPLAAPLHHSKFNRSNPGG